MPKKDIISDNPTIKLLYFPLENLSSDLHGNIERLDRVRDRPHGDDVHAGFSDGFDIVKRDVAGSLRQRFAVNQADSIFHLVEGHIVEHDNVRACFDSFFHFVERSCLHFDLDRMTDFSAQRINGFRDTAAGVDVIVLEHRRVGQIIAVIVTAAAGHGVFLDGAETRERLSRVGDRGICTLHRSDRRVRHRRDARHMLQKIERRPLTL